MNAYFAAIVDEILRAVVKFPEDLPLGRISRPLAAFRLPIMLVKASDMNAGCALADAHLIYNAYFTMVFGSVASVETNYPNILVHLLSIARDGASGIALAIKVKRQNYDVTLNPVKVQGESYILMVVDYHVEYAQLLSHQEKYLMIDLVRKTNDFIGLADDIGNFVFINESGLRLLRMSLDDVHLLNVWDLHDHKELRQILEAGRQADGSFSWVGQARIRTHEDKWLFCSLSITTLISEGQRFYATIMRDMSSLKRLEAQITSASAKIEATVAERTEDVVELNLQLLHEIEASERMRYMLQEREQRLSTILETTLDGFFMMDANLRIEQTNRAFQVLTGTLYKNLEGERMMRFLPKASKDKLKSVIEAISSGQRLLLDLPIQTLSGDLVPCSISLNPYYIEGHLRGYFGFIRPLDLSAMPSLGDFYV